MTIKEFVTIIATSLFVGVLIQPAFAQDVTTTTAPTTVPTVVNTTPLPTDGKSEGRGMKLGPTIRAYRMDEELPNARGIRQKLDFVKGNREWKRQNLVNQVQGMRDEKKKDVLLRIDTKISSVSARRTEHMTSVVEKLNTILTTIKQKATLAQQAGVDITALDKAIDEADSALASASAAIELQASKTYDLSITDEATAKPNVSTAVQQLQHDLQTTHASVIAAKKAVMMSAKELHKIWHMVKLSGTPVPSNTTVTPTAVLTPEG